MKLTRTVLILLVLAAAVCAQEVKVTITDLLVFKNDKSVSKDYLFGMIYKVRTDSKNNIYIQEYQQGPLGNTALIKMYSPKGKYIRTIGRHGQGPGDFNSIGDFTILNNGKLLIMDRLLYRLTLYDPGKNKFEVLLSNVKDIPMNAELYGLEDDKLLVVSSDFYEKTKNLLFIKSIDMKKGFYEFGHPEIFFNKNDPAIDDKASYSKIPLNVCIIDENKLAAVPDFYDGILAMFTREGNEWKGKRFKGAKSYLDSFAKISMEDWNKGNMNELARLGARLKTSKGYGCIQRSGSQKIYTYKNNYILHFFRIIGRSKNAQSQLDIFDMDGKYLGNNTLFWDSDDGKEVRKFTVYWKDKDDNFYIVEHDNGLPILKKVKLELTF